MPAESSHVNMPSFLKIPLTKLLQTLACHKKGAVCCGGSRFFSLQQCCDEDHCILKGHGVNEAHPALCSSTFFIALAPAL